MPKPLRRAIAARASRRRTRRAWALAAALIFLGLPGTAQENPATDSSTLEPPENSYTEAMSLGLGSLAAGQWGPAQTAFEAANRARDGDAAAADGLEQVRQARKLASLRNRQQRALAFESRDEWAKAQAEYRSALAVDPRLAFARKGEQISGQRAALLDQLDEFVAAPERLESRDVLEQARRLMHRGEEAGVGSDRIRNQALKLEHLVRLASTPRTVVIESDGKTSIQVYKVGAIGSFQHKELSLVPGRYVVVGSRDGYRDVRREIRIAIDRPVEPIRVVCTEPMP